MKRYVIHEQCGKKLPQPVFGPIIPCLYPEFYDGILFGEDGGIYPYSDNTLKLADDQKLKVKYELYYREISFSSGEKPVSWPAYRVIK